MNQYWILNEANEPVQADLQTFLEWEGDPAHWRVDYQLITATAYVSTRFMGLNMDIQRDLLPHLNLPPLLFETCAFDEGQIIAMRRSCTWEEAKADHAAVVKGMEARMQKKQ